MSKTPITDANELSNEDIGRAGFPWGTSGLVRAHVARRLEEDRAELVEALRGVCDAVSEFRSVENKGLFSESLADKHDEAIISARALLSRIDGGSND